MYQEIRTDEWPTYICQQEFPFINPASYMQLHFLFAVASDAGTVCGDEFFLKRRALPLLLRCWHDADLGSGIDQESPVRFCVV